MLQIKIISYPAATDVEDAFRNWTKKKKVEILQTKYCTVLFEQELYHSVMILYKPREE
jgi:hypothetical protein